MNAVVLVSVSSLYVAGAGQRVRTLTSAVKRSGARAVTAHLQRVGPRTRIVPVDGFCATSGTRGLLSTRPSIVVSTVSSLVPGTRLVTSYCHNGRPLMAYNNTKKHVGPTQVRVSSLSHAEKSPLLSDLHCELGGSCTLPLKRGTQGLGVPYIFSRRAPMCPAYSKAASYAHSPRFRKGVNYSTKFNSIARVAKAFNFFTTSTTVRVLLGGGGAPSSS